jgi:group I intron endonuclease
MNLLNGKIYIGKDKNNNPKYLGSGKLLRLAIEKYGLNNFVKEILEDGLLTIEELNKREIHWISYYNSHDKSIGYNITLGGDGGDTLSNHPNKKTIAEKKRNSMLGKNTGKRSNETKLKMSNNRIGKGLGNKPWHAGKTNSYSTETLKKLSKAAQGINNPMFGKHHSEETKEKIRQKAVGRIGPRTGKFKKFIFTKNDIEIASIDGQTNAILYCKQNNLPYSVLVKKLLPWNEYKCITKII